jgi:hypothetical protein
LKAEGGGEEDFLHRWWIEYFSRNLKEPDHLNAYVLIPFDEVDGAWVTDSFAWLELISHRTFMPKLLLSNPQKGWPLFQRLLVALFKFMEPYLRNADVSDPVCGFFLLQCLLYTVARDMDQVCN